MQTVNNAFEMESIVSRSDFVQIVHFAVRNFELKLRGLFDSVEDFAQEVAISIYKGGKRVDKKGRRLADTSIICKHCLWAFGRKKHTKSYLKNQQNQEIDSADKEDNFRFPELDNVIELAFACEALSGFEKEVLQKAIDSQSIPRPNMTRIGEELDVTRQYAHKVYQEALVKLRVHLEGKL